MRMALAIVFLFIAVSPAAIADERDAVMSGAARCASFADKRIWLECFYGSAQPMRAALALAPAPATQTGLVPPADPTQRVHASSKPPAADEQGGFFHDLLGSSQPIVPGMALASYTFARNGRFTVKLKDGQVWQQDENDVASAKWTGQAASYTVTISHGTLNSFTLRVRGDALLYQVHPVR
jgi:hypothetical protein